MRQFRGTFEDCQHSHLHRDRFCHILKGMSRSERMTRTPAECESTVSLKRARTHSMEVALSFAKCSSQIAINVRFFFGFNAVGRRSYPNGEDGVI